MSKALREAAQQALEALERSRHWSPLYRGSMGVINAIDDLRAALAEPEGGGNLPPPLQEPTVAENATTQQQIEQTPPSDYRRGYWAGFAIGKREGRIEAEDEPAQQAEPVEPVAKVELMMTGGNAGLATRIVEIDDHLRERLRPGQLLYTAPPQRKPLTEEEIIDAVRDADLDWAKGWTLDEMQGNRFATLARAIERAHGIGDSDE